MWYCIKFTKGLDTSPGKRLFRVLLSEVMRPSLLTGKLLVLFRRKHIFYFYLEDITKYRCGSLFKYTGKVNNLNY